MEIIIVIAIIIASIAYAVKRIMRTTKGKNCACDDCPGCALKEQMQKTKKIHTAAVKNHKKILPYQNN